MRHLISLFAGDPVDRPPFHPDPREVERLRDALRQNFFGDL